MLSAGEGCWSILVTHFMKVMLTPYRLGERESLNHGFSLYMPVFQSAAFFSLGPSNCVFFVKLAILGSDSPRLTLKIFRELCLKFPGNLFTKAKRGGTNPTPLLNIYFNVGIMPL